MIGAREFLEIVSFGNSVAEHDNDLKDYFVETSSFSDFVKGSGDIVAGDKGTGKSAIYRILKENYREYPELNNVELVDSFNLHGNPIFQRLTQTSNLTEGELRTLWKSYIFSLVGNWILEIYPENFNEKIKRLTITLEHLDLRSLDPSPATIFSKIVSSAKRLKSAETAFTLTETGLPVIIPKVTFDEERTEGEEIYCDDFLNVLSEAVSSTGYKLWILFDRLDEAFAGRPDTEIPALRALLRTYLDLVGLPGIELKLFLRRDLFRRVTEGGFVNLSHINARTIDIIWDDEDLWSMITRRIAKNSKFRGLYDGGNVPDNILEVLLPDQIDIGEKQSHSTKWILNRVRDGNNVKPPRSVIDIMNDARAAQVRKESREERSIDPNKGPILEAQSVKRAFAQLSEKRVQDTLIAEAGEFAQYVENFRDGKAEHSRDTLKSTIRDEEKFNRVLKGLIELGFLEQESETFKIPMLYRNGLNITQGKAF